MFERKDLSQSKIFRKLSRHFGWSHAYEQHVLRKYREAGNYRESVSAMEADYSRYHIE